MLVRHVPDAYEKLRILGGMAGDDILSPSGAGHGTNTSRMPYRSPSKNPVPGVYRASMPNGKHISLMRVMFTDFCMMDCAYCPNSHWVPRRRYAFKVDELARLFDELRSRHTVDGLFLSSGIAGSGSKTTERLVQVVDPAGPPQVPVRRVHPSEGDAGDRVRIRGGRAPPGHAAVGEHRDADRRYDAEAQPQ